jgi:hypothetical protein
LSFRGLSEPNVIGLSEPNVIGLLRAYGRDVAGALQIWDPDVPGEPKQPALEPLSSAGVAGMLEHVQDKIVLARIGEGWNRVIDGWPSTHVRGHEKVAPVHISCWSRCGCRVLPGVASARRSRVRPPHFA